MHVSTVAPAGFLWQPHDEWAVRAIRQRSQRFVDLTDVADLAHSARSTFQFSRRLRTAQQQLANDGSFDRREFERSEFGVAESLLIFRDSTAEPRAFDHEVFSHQSIEYLL